MAETTRRRQRVFSGRLLGLEVLDVQLEDGTLAVREIVRHPGASVVLGRLPDQSFVFVRQYRKPLEQEVLEAVAGGLEAGETPEACARREMLEETGHAVASLRKLGVIFPAPGYTDERLHVYYADLEAGQKAAAADDDERLDVVYIGADGVEDRIRSGEIGDAKTLAAWLLYLRQVAAAGVAEQGEG